MDIRAKLTTLGFIKVKSSHGYYQYLNNKIDRIISFTETKMTIFNTSYHIKYDGKIPTDNEFLIKLIESTNG